MVRFTWSISGAFQPSHSEHDGPLVLLHDFEGEAERERQRNEHQQERAYSGQQLDESSRSADLRLAARHRRFLCFLPREQKKGR